MFDLTKATKDFLLELRLALVTLDTELTGTVFLKDDSLILHEGDLRLTVDFPVNEAPLSDEEEQPPAKQKSNRRQSGPAGEPSLFHAHVTAWMGKEAAVPLDACLIASEEEQNPLRKMANTWLRLVAPPLLSYLNKRPVLNALSFTGTEFSGVLRRQGYAGPLEMKIFTSTDQKRTEAEEIECRQMLDRLRSEPLFLNAAELAGDDGLHLVKSVLACFGNGWTRALEMDVHCKAIPQLPWPPDEWTLTDIGKTKLTCPVIVISYAIFSREQSVPDTNPLVSELPELFEKLLRSYSAEPPTDIYEAVERFPEMDESMLLELNNILALAFGRSRLQRTGLSFSDRYYVIHEDGNWSECLFRENRYYGVARLLAEGFEFSPVTARGVEWLVGESSEINAVSNMIIEYEESQLANFHLLPPCFAEPGTPSDVYSNAIEKIQQIELRRLKQSGRKWWQFWKWFDW